MDKKQKTALILNIVIFVLAVVGSIFCFGEIYIIQTKPIEHGIKLLKFFTVQSNVMAGITSLLYIIFFLRERKRKKKIPSFVNILRYIATIDLIITFLVVALFLGFIVEEGYLSLYFNANFFFHFAIPVLNFVSFTFFENSFKLRFRDTFWGMSHLILYSIFYLIIVLTHIKDGAVSLEYDWYAFAQFGFGVLVALAVSVLGAGYLISYLLFKFYNRKSVKNRNVKKKM